MTRRHIPTRSHRPHLGPYTALGERTSCITPAFFNTTLIDSQRPMHGFASAPPSFEPTPQLMRNSECIPSKRLHGEQRMKGKNS